MFDDRKSDKQFVVVFSPGDKIGRVDQMTIAEISAAVGGFASVSRWGDKFLIYHGCRRNTECQGAAANRVIDSMTVYGLMVVIGLDYPLTGPQAANLAYDCPWRMQKMEVAV